MDGTLVPAEPACAHVREVPICSTKPKRLQPYTPMETAEHQLGRASNLAGLSLLPGCHLA